MLAFETVVPFAVTLRLHLNTTDSPAPPQHQMSRLIRNESSHEKFNGSLECIYGNVKDFDVAVAVAAGHANDEEVDKFADLRLRRKIDRHILPLLFFIYCGGSLLVKCTVCFTTMLIMLTAFLA